MDGRGLRVRPVEGRTVRHPEPPYRLLAADGEEVPRSQYWLRMIRAGDVAEVAEAAAPRADEPAPTRSTKPTRRTSGGSD